MRTIVDQMINKTLDKYTSLICLRDSMFPLTYTPFLKGVTFNIQMGHLLLSYDNSMIRNYELKELLRPIRERTINNNYLISGVLKSNSGDDGQIINALKLNWGDLPEDMEVHFTEVVVRDSMKIMTRAMRDANMWLAGLDLKIPNVFFHKQSKANTLKELQAHTSSILFKEIFDGITVHKPNGKYMSGYDIKNWESVNIDYSREVVGKLKLIDWESTQVGKGRNNFKNVISRIILELPNGSIIKYSLENVNLLERSTMYDNKDWLIDANITLEINEIPLLKKPIVKKIISIDPL